MSGEFVEPLEDRAYPEGRVFQAPIRIGFNETQLLADASGNADIAQTIAMMGGAIFEDVLEPALLESWTRVAYGAAWNEVDMRRFGVRSNDLSPSTALPFCLVLARAPFMRWLEAITGCASIAAIEGHVSQMRPDHVVGWHRDAGLGIRRLAMVINLTSSPYEGARFLLRRKSTQEPMFAYRATAPGSLAVFRIGDDLQHSVTRLTAGGPRTTFSGWARGPWAESDSKRDVSLVAWPPLVPAAGG